MPEDGRWMMNESAEKERIDLASDLGSMETVQVDTLKRLKLLDPENKEENTIMYMTPEERDSLHEFTILLLKVQRGLKKAKKRWKQRHIKACSDPGCRKIVGRAVEKCPECGLDTKWYKTDEQGNPTEVEIDKTPPPVDVREAHPILHNDASEIVDRAQHRAKKQLIDRATSKGYEVRTPDDLREGAING